MVPGMVRLCCKSKPISDFSLPAAVKCFYRIYEYPQGFVQKVKVRPLRLEKNLAMEGKMMTITEECNDKHSPESCHSPLRLRLVLSSAVLLSTLFPRVS